MKIKIVTVPKVLYHATYQPLLPSILKNGLGNAPRKSWAESEDGVIYLATDQHVAESYAEASDDVDEDWLDQIVVLRVSTNSLLPANFFVDRNNQTGDTIEYHGVIPASNLTVL